MVNLLRFNPGSRGLEQVDLTSLEVCLHRFKSRSHVLVSSAALLLPTATAVVLGVNAPSALAQADAGRLAGAITDPSGAVVPDAPITLVNTNTGALRTGKSSSSGTYEFAGVPAGSYVETVSAPGFATYKAAVTITVGGNATLDVALSTAAQNTVVEVQATNDATQINTTTPEISQVINPRQVLDLPSLTRNPYDFVALSGNAASDPGGSTSRGVGVAISGQRAAGTEILLDGVENENNYDATPGQNIPLDAVQEYRVVTSGFDAQYGRASGGVVNLITRTGTNKLHGSVYEFNRISALASNTWNENATNYALRASGQPTQPGDHFTRNQFGYSVGGPIKRDKLFFFSNTEWNRIRSTGKEQFEIPTASFIAASSPATQAFFAQYGAVDPRTILGATVPVAGFASDPLQIATKVAAIDAGAGTPQNTWSTLNRFDYTVNPKISMYFRAADYSEVDFAGTNSLSPYVGYDTGTTTFNQSYLYNLDIVISNSLLSNSKVSYSRQNTAQPINGAPVPSLYLNQANTASTDNTTGNFIVFPGYLPTSPGNALPFGGPSNVYQFQQNLTYTKGKHTLTLGGEFFQLRDNRTFGAYEEAVEQVAKNGTKYALALGALQAGNIYSFEVAINPQGKLPCAYNQAGALVTTPSCTLTLPATSPDFERENTFNDGNWYVQDSWKASKNLTLTGGIRWDYYGVQHNHNPNLESNFFFGSGETVPQQVANGQVLTTPNSPVGGLMAKQLKNYAPRVGVAWDPFGNGKWSIRSGFGISYERNFGNVTYNVIQNPPNYAGVTLVSNYNAITRPTGTQYTLQTSNFGPFAGSSGAVPLAPSSIRALQQNMPTAYTEEWSLAVEHQLSRADLVSVEYSGAHGVHQYAIAPFNGIGYGTFNGSTNPSAYHLNRLNPQYASINQRLANGSNSYDGLNVRFQSNDYQRIGLQLSVNYTLSHALDNLSSTFSESGNNFNLGYLNPFNPSLDRGNADYDVRHRVSIGGLYRPNWLDFKSNRIAHVIAGGLEFAPIAVLRTGTPFTIYDCTNAINNCPRVVPAPGLTYHNSVGANNSINSFNFAPVPVAAGNLFVNSQGYSDFSDTLGGYQNPGVGRNQFYGPNNITFNLGAYKNFTFGEGDRYGVQLRAEFYNVLNHSNYYPELGSADYSGLVTPATAATATAPAMPAIPGNLQAEKGVIGGGSPTSADERRNTQLAIRLQF